MPVLAIFIGGYTRRTPLILPMFCVIVSSVLSKSSGKRQLAYSWGDLLGVVLLKAGHRNPRNRTMAATAPTHAKMRHAFW